jgi:hypothetical protein
MQANPQMPNPFYDYDAVSNLFMFFGRERELQIVYQAILKHQSVSIVGSRHIGKSALLKFLGNAEIQQRYGYAFPQFLFVYTDWRAYLHKKREDFFHQLCAQIVAQSQEKLALQLSPYAGEDRLLKLLEDIQSAGFYLVLLMDAFDQVTSNPEFDARFFSFLRSLAGVNNLISYVTATRKSLHLVCHSAEVAGSPFFNSFLPCALGAFTPAEARALIASPAEQAHYPFTPAEIEWIFEQAGPHPFFLQVACRHLFTEKSRQAPSTIPLIHVQRLIYEELLPHFDHLWGELEENEREQLRQEMFQHAHFPQPLLELSGSLLFRKRMRSLSQDDLIRLSEEDIREALERLDDTEFLAQSQLGKLQCIALQIGESPDGPANKRGMLVRDLLKKAFEQTRPGDIRNDSALEWRLYNIFWYRYFKHRLPNPTIAARLNISVRQFYREREKALHGLLKEVLDIESHLLDRLS